MGASRRKPIWWPFSSPTRRRSAGIWRACWGGAWPWKQGQMPRGSIPRQSMAGGPGSFAAGEAMGDGSYGALFAEASRYIGYPYVWGGSSPATSFDCSGYICWIYTQSGVYNLPRTSADGLYHQCAIVLREEARPGDLVFFYRDLRICRRGEPCGDVCGGLKNASRGGPDWFW